MDKKIGKVLAIVLAVAMVFGSVNLTTPIFAEENIEPYVLESIDNTAEEEDIAALAEENIDDAAAEEDIAVLAEENIDDADEEEGIAVLAEENEEIMPLQDEGSEITVTTASDLAEKVKNAESDTIIRLDGTPKDGEVVFELEETLSIPSDVPITIKGTEGTTYRLKAKTVNEDGNYAVINIPEGSTLNLENVVVDANQAGRVVYNAGTLNVTNGSLENGNSGTFGDFDVYGTGIYNEGSLTLKGNATVQKNTATITEDDWYYYGIGIYNKGSVTLKENAVVENNSVTISASGNYVYGVGIYNENSLTMSGTSAVQNNSTTGTGSVCGVAIYNTGTFTMNGNSMVQNNSATGTGSVYGVGIYNEKLKDSVGSVTLDGNVVVQNNSSSSTGTTYGVGIYNGGSYSTAEVNIKGFSVIQNNSCTGKSVQGVGIYDKYQLTMDADTVVKENKYEPTVAGGSGYGIGIYCDSTSYSLTLNNTIYNNQAIVKNVEGNVNVRGVGVYYSTSSRYFSITIDNASITDNKAEGDFGSGSILGVGCYLSSYTKNPSLYDAVISGNDFSGATAGTKSGAGVYTQYSLIIGGSTQIKGNHTDNLYLSKDYQIFVKQEMKEEAQIDITYGGESDISSSVPTNLVSLMDESEGQYFSYTSVNQDGDADEPSYKVGVGKDDSEQAYFQIISTILVPGGEVEVSDEDALITGLAEAGNDPADPTIIKLQKDIEITKPLNIILDRQVQITSVEEDGVQKNYKLSIGEEAESMSTMLTTAGFLTLSNVTLDAGGKARVVSVSKGAKVTIDDGATITGGYLKDSHEVGAGLYIAIGASATLTGGSITGNMANGTYSQGQNKGIGVYNAGTFTMTSGSITNNTATKEAIESAKEGISGGALYNDGTIVPNNPAKFEITGGTISGNSATNSGGAIYNSAPTENIIKNVTIENNQAVSYSDGTGRNVYKGTYGGAIYTNAGTITISGDTDTDTEIKGNSALNGGGIYVTGTSAAASTASHGTVIMDDERVKIEGNETVTDTGYGAGVFVDGGKFTLNAGTISGNKIPSYKVSDESDASELEWYQGLGGGIYVNGSRSESNDKAYQPTLELFGGKITGNTAENGGSGIYVSNFAYQYEILGAQESYAYGASLVKVKGSPVVTDNNGDDIRLARAELIDEEDDTNQPSVQRLTVVAGGLSQDAQLNVSKKICLYENELMQEVEDNVFAVAGEGYSLTDTDVNAISCQALNDDLYQIMKEDADEGTGYKSIYASKVDLSSFTVSLEKDTYTYTGSEIKPSVSVTLGGEALGTEDYTLEYEDNINVGTATVKIIIEKESITGSLTEEFQITPKVLTDSEDGELSPLTIGTEPITYNGKEQLPSITVKDGDITLEKDKDYKVSCEDCITAGEKTLTVTGIGNYEGTTLTGTFTIEKASIEKADVTGVNNAVYTGSAITCALTVTADGNTLKENTDYTVKYDNNINAGTATVTISGTGNYTGTLTKTFAIAKANQTISGVNKSYTQTYSKNGSMTLKATAKSTVSYSSSKKDVATIDSKTGKITYVGAGTTTITITAAGTENYNQATTTVTLTVNRAKQTITAKVAKKTYKVSKLKKRKASFNIGAKSSSNGTLKYSVSKYPKKAKKFISVTKKGKVTMKKKAPKGTYKITVTANQTNQYNKATKTVTVKVAK